MYSTHTVKLVFPESQSGLWLLERENREESVKRPTLDLSSGHDLTIHEFEPHVGLSAESVESAWDSLSLPLPYSVSLSKINKLKKLKSQTK